MKEFHEIMLLLYIFQSNIQFINGILIQSQADQSTSFLQFEQILPTIFSLYPNIQIVPHSIINIHNKLVDLLKNVPNMYPCLILFKEIR